jgi:hypothetical protein
MGLILFFESQKSIFLIISILITPPIMKSFIDMLRLRDFLFFFFLALLYELWIVMVVRIFIFEIREDSWRVLFNKDALNLSSFRIIVISILIFLIFYVLRISKNKTPWKPFQTPFHPVMEMVLLAVAGIYLILYVSHQPYLFQRRNYSSVEFLHPTWLSLFRIFLAMQIFSFFSRRKKTRWRICALAIRGGYLLIASILTWNGYRFILVEVGVLFFFLYYKQAKNLHILKLTFLGIIVYLSLTYLKIMHLDALSEVDGTNVFAHERNIFFSLNAIIQNRPSNPSNTYIKSLSKFLPTALTGNDVFSNTGQTLVGYILPQSDGRMITMGAFYLAEAFFNLGPSGVYMVTIIFSFLFLWLEKCKDRESGVLLMIYYFILTQVVSVIYYGSSNYGKLIVYFFVIIKLLNFINAFIFEKDYITT